MILNYRIFQWRLLFVSCVLVAIGIFFSLAIAPHSNEVAGATDLSIGKEQNATIASIEHCEGQVDLAMARIRQSSVSMAYTNWINSQRLLLGGARSKDIEVKSKSLLKAFFRDIVPSDELHVSPFQLRDGYLYARFSKGTFQEEEIDHEYLSCLALSEAPITFSFSENSKVYSIFDLLMGAKREATFMTTDPCLIIALSHYVAPTEKWINKFGESISLSGMAKALLLDNSICETSYGRMSMACLYQAFKESRDAEGKAVVRLASERLRQDMAELRSTQDPEGSFVKASYPSVLLAQESVRFQITGRELEWITYAVSPDQLRQDWIVKAVDFVAGEIAGRIALVSDATFPTSEERMAYGDICHAMSAIFRWKQGIHVSDLGEKEVD